MQAALRPKLGDQIGLPITEEKAAKVTVADIKLMLSGEETVDPDVDNASIKLAVRHLWGAADDAENLPTVSAYKDGDMPGSLARRGRLQHRRESRRTLRFLPALS